MARLQAFDDSFDPDKSASYSLLVSASLNALRVVVYDSQQECFIGSATQLVATPLDPDWAAEFAAFQSDFSWSSNPFAQVVLGWRSGSLTLIPQEIYEEEKAKEIAQAAIMLRPTEAIYTQPIDNGCLALFAVPSELIQSFSQWQNHFLTASPDAAIARWASLSWRCECALILHLAGDLATLILLREGKIDAMLPCKGKALDLLYRAQLLMKTLGIAPEKCPYVAMGSGLVALSEGESELSIREVNRLFDEYFPAMDLPETISLHKFCDALYPHRGEQIGAFALQLCAL